jgi:crotonobetainyl-CoA:carnitine CoA-transferase CaiB-like acyl-CoA transferase
MKVVDLSTDVAGRFAAKLFAMAGADVYRPSVSLDETDTTDGDALSTYLDFGKRPVALDRDNTLASLLARADLVFTSFDAGHYLGLAAQKPLLSETCIEVTTSTFGISGPYSHYRGGPLADWAAGGYLAITGEPGRPPLIGPENLCAYVCGYEAALGAEAALRASRESGRGQHVDVSTMETMLCLHQSTFSQLGAGSIRARTGRYAEVYPLVVRPCKTGYVSLGIVSDEEFDRLAIAFGLLSVAADERFGSRENRMENRDALDRELASFLLAHEADEVVALLQANGVASAKVVDALEILDNPQLGFRAFWESPANGMMPGNPIPRANVFAAQSFGSKPPKPPSIRAHDSLPLVGTTVLDFTAFWAGPSATRCLADMGADVIWIERPRSRLDFDTQLSDSRAVAQHLYHQKMNRHKRSVVLDLDTDEGRETARELASRADVLVENFRPGVADRLGLGAAKLCAMFPRLVYVSLSGFGSAGPWSNWRSYGPNIEAASSILARTGYRGGEPMRLGHALPDGVGGIAGALTALRGLRARNQHGHGGWYDVSQLEVYAALGGEDILTASLTGDRMAPIGNRSRSGAIQGVFACRGDDQWIAIRLNDQADVERFATKTGLSSFPDLAQTTPRDDTAIEELIGAYTQDNNKFELAQRLQSAGLEAVPVYSADELAVDPHVIARKILVEVDCGGRRCLLPGSPLHSSPALVNPHGRAPRFGEHTSEVVSKKETQ